MTEPSNRSESELDSVLASLHWQRLGRLTEPRLDLAVEVVERLQQERNQIPPLGWIIDIINLLLGGPAGMPINQGIPARITYTYQDDVINRMLESRELERVGAWLRTQCGRESAPAIAFTIQCMLDRLAWNPDGWSPSTVREMRAIGSAACLDRLRTDHDRRPPNWIQHQYLQLIDAFRRTAWLLDEKDVYLIRSGAALLDHAGRLALEQISECRDRLNDSSIQLKRSSPLPTWSPDSRQVETPASYPLGGYSAIGRSGTPENLLHSELAFMDEQSRRPDLFDLKVARQELLYYERDESHRTAHASDWNLILDDSLKELREPHPEYPCQTGIILLSWIQALVESIHPRGCRGRVRIRGASLADSDQDQYFETGWKLELEMELISLLLRNQIADSSVQIDSVQDMLLIPTKSSERYSLPNSGRDILTTADTNFDRAVERMTAQAGSGLIMGISSRRIRAMRLRYGERDAPHPHLVLDTAANWAGWSRLLTGVTSWLQNS